MAVHGSDNERLTYHGDGLDGSLGFGDSLDGRLGFGDGHWDTAGIRTTGRASLSRLARTNGSHGDIFGSGGGGGDSGGFLLSRSRFTGFSTRFSLSLLATLGSTVNHYKRVLSGLREQRQDPKWLDAKKWW